MNLCLALYEHLSKLEIIVYKKFNAKRSKIPGNSCGHFLKTYSRELLGIPERELLGLTTAHHTRLAIGLCDMLRVTLVQYVPVGLHSVV